MEKVKGWMGNDYQFSRSRKRSFAAVGTAVGATIGFGIATSKVGLFVAGVVGVAFAITVGAVAGRVVGEVLAQKKVECIPPQA